MYALNEMQKGLALLDTHVPGWYNEVNLSTLRMSSPEACVLSQSIPTDSGLFSDAVLQLWSLMPESPREAYVYYWARDNGFDVPSRYDKGDNDDGDGDLSWANADSLWTEAIVIRRVAHSV